MKTFAWSNWMSAEAVLGVGAWPLTADPMTWMIALARLEL